MEQRRDLATGIRAVEMEGEERMCRRLRERAERDLRAEVPDPEGLDEATKGMPGRPRLGRPERAQHEQSGGLEPPCDDVEEVEGRVVGPVEVLEHQYRRLVCAEGLQHLHDLAQHAVARDADHARLERCPLLLGDEPGKLDEPRGRTLAEELHEPAAVVCATEPSQGLEDGHVRLARAPALDALAPADVDGRVETLEEREDEGGLARARLPAHEHEPPLAGGGVARRTARAGRAPGRGRRLRPADGRRPPSAADPTGRGGGARRRRLRGERRVLLQDPALELTQMLRGLDAELVGELLPERLVRVERLGLAARPVERQHQLLPQPLPQGVARGERVELGNEHRMPAERQICVDPLLEEPEPHLLEPGGFGRRERLVQLGERRPAPERQRLCEDSGRVRRIPARERRTSLAGKALGQLHVELAVRDDEHVPGAPGRETPLGESLAELRDVDLKRLHGGLRDALAPQVVDQLRHRHRAVRVQEQVGEERALLARGNRDAPAVVGHLERAEKAEFHAAEPSPPLRAPRGGLPAFCRAPAGARSASAASHTRPEEAVRESRSCSGADPPRGSPGPRSRASSPRAGRRPA